MFLKWFQLPQLLPVSLLHSNSTCAEFLLWGLCIFKIFWASFLITFLSPGIGKSIHVHVPFLLSWIMMSSLLLGRALLVCTCWFHNIVTSPSWLFLTVFGTWSHQCSLYYFTPISLHMLKCNPAHAVLSLFVLLFSQYWACWYDMFHSLIKLFTESPFAIGFCV